MIARGWRAALLLAALAALASLALAARQVAQHERGELAYEGTAKSLAERTTTSAGTAEPAPRVTAQLAAVELQAGEEVVFELCADDPLRDPHWVGAFELAILEWPGPTLMLRVPLDAAHLALAQRSEREACLRLGGGTIERAGRYTLEAVWPKQPPPEAVRQVALRGRVLARRALGPLDRAAVVGLLAAIALLLGTLLAAPRVTERVTEHETGRTSLRALLYGALAVGALVLATFAPLNGSTLGLLKGALLFALQVTAALVLVRTLVPSEPRAALALQRPSRPALWLPIAIAAAFLLAQCARLSLEWVPRTGVSPIETFVSWPSGTLAFATLGVLLPCGEELFFRGYLYRILLRFGPLAAAAGAWLVFVALHVAQSWGNWGGLLAIALTGLVLTGLRALSGSLLVPALFTRALQQRVVPRRALGDVVQASHDIGEFIDGNVA